MENAAGNIPLMQEKRDRRKPYLNTNNDYPTVRTIVEASAAAGIPRAPKARCRIMILHGLGTSGAIAEDLLTWSLCQLPTRAELSDMLDVHTFDAPHEEPMIQQVADFYPRTMRTFSWEDPSKPLDRSRWQESINAIVRQYEEHGPFDAILGQSQGSVMATIILRLQQQGAIQTKFKFAICTMTPEVPGFLGEDFASEILLTDEDRIATPVAFMFYLDDPIAYKPPSGITETKYFSDVCIIRDIVGGHSLPTPVGDDLEACCGFIRRHMG